MDPVTIGMALAQFAPALIKLFTGSDKAEDVAGKVIDIAKTVTGTDTGRDALDVLKVDPNAAIEFRKAVAAQQVELEKAYLADIANARQMQVAALEQDDLFSKRFVYVFAAAWSLFAMSYFFFVTFYALSPGGQRVADTILGVLISSVLGSILSYFYGSTKGSAEKNRLLAAK